MQCEQSTSGTQSTLTGTEKAKILLVEMYWYHQKLPSLARKALRDHLGQHSYRDLPDEGQITRIVQKFHDTGTILPDLKEKVEGTVTIATEENVKKCEEFYKKNQESSVGKASELGLSPKALQCLVEQKVKLYPYKVQCFQQLSDFDETRRLQFAQKMVNKMNSSELKGDKVWFSDEAHFWISGYVNKQNHRFWAKTNPHRFVETQMKPKRVTVWCAICPRGIIGPYFFDDYVNGEAYLEMLQQYFIPQIKEKNAIDDYWYMQDGALLHRTQDVMDYLHDNFPGRVIGLGYNKRFGCGIGWPPYSPDINPCDYYLWGRLKDQVYKTAPKNIKDLKEQIKIQLLKIPHEEIRNVILNFKNRCLAIIENDGGHIEQFY